MLDAVAALVPAMRGWACVRDETEPFPDATITALRHTDVLAAFPRDPAALFRLLRLLGQGNPAIGRLVEDHVNAWLLIDSYATARQAASWRSRQ